MGSTETQRNFLRAVDPFVRQAIARPKSTLQEILMRWRGRQLTVPQREAVIEGVEEGRKEIARVIEILNQFSPGKERQLVVQTASLLVKVGTNPSDASEAYKSLPQELLKLYKSDQDKARSVIGGAQDLVLALAPVIKGGFDISEYIDQLSPAGK